MRKSILRASAVLLGLALPFMVGCQERETLLSADNSSSKDAGKIAFRLSGDELAKVSLDADSVRIEADRAGYSARFATGSLSGSTLLQDLAPGGWTLKVALYDKGQAIRWYGETIANIRSGETVDAVVVLKRASGSVRIRIVLDTTVPVVGLDTIVPAGMSTGAALWAPISVEKTAGGIYLKALRVCGESYWVRYGPIKAIAQPVQNDGLAPQSIIAKPYLMIADSSTLFLEKGVNPAVDCRGLVDTVVHFIPWTRRGAVSLITSNGTIVVKDTLSPPDPPVDTAWTAVTVVPSYGIAPSYAVIDKIWRDDSNVYIQTRTYDPASMSQNCGDFVVRPIPDSGSVLRFGANPLVDCAYPGRLVMKYLVRIPWSGCGKLTVLDANGKSYPLPIARCAPPVPAIDTIRVEAIYGDPNKYKGIPVNKAWRTDSGVYIATQYDYFQPVAIRDMNKNIGRRILTLVGNPIWTYAPVALAPHIVFVPFPGEEEVVVANLLDTNVIVLPGKPVPPVKDSSFVLYQRSVKSAWARSSDLITLYPSGVALRQTTNGLNTLKDTVVLARKAMVPVDSLAKIKRILESSSSRHPGPLPTQSPGTSCPTDMPSNSRSISYADGTMSSMSWNRSAYCDPLPASWQALDPVDAILLGLFP